MNKDYISIGKDCHTAHTLGKIFGTTLYYPFDCWGSYHLPDLFRIIESKFAGFIKEEYNDIHGHEGKFQPVLNEGILIRYLPLSSKYSKEDRDNANQKIQRRIDRFIQKLEGGNVVLVRNCNRECLEYEETIFEHGLYKISEAYKANVEGKLLCMDVREYNQDDWVERWKTQLTETY